MPIATIQLSTGRIAKIEVPEGATPEAIKNFVMSQPELQPQPSPQEPTQPGIIEKIGRFGIPDRGGKRPSAGEVARPFLQAAKNIAVGTIGSAGDLAQQAAFLPEAIGRGTARSLGANIEPFDMSKVNTVSPTIRGGIDRLTGGLTTPRTRTEEVQQVGGEVLGGIIGPGAIKTAGKAIADVSSLIAKRGTQFATGITEKSKELVEAFQDAGVNPTLANISQGQTTKTFQNLLGNFPGSRGVIEKATQGQIDDITKQIAGITKSKGGTIEETGQVIQTGAKDFKTASQARVSKLYDDLDEFIPKEQVTPTNNLKALSQDPAIQDVVAVGAGDTAKVLKRYSGIVDEAGSISYPRLKVFRSTVGRKLQSSSLPGDERGAIKQIYGALSEDMKSAVQIQGGEKGLLAFNKANSAFAKQTETLEKTINPLINAKTPEKVFTMALSGTKQGGTNIKAIMNKLNPTQQEFVQGTVVNRMGLSQPGQQDALGTVFSPNKFLTEWNRLSPEARVNIFTPKQTNSITNLNKVLSSLKDTSKAAQTSNNLPYAAWAGLGGLTATSPIAGVGALGGARITAKMMTSPRFVKWLAQTPRIRAVEIPKHLKVLSTISLSNGELRDDILDYLDSITTQPQEGK